MTIVRRMFKTPRTAHFILAMFAALLALPLLALPVVVISGIDVAHDLQTALWLALVALTGLIVSFARPQATVATPRREGTVVLAFDTSSSMAASWAGAREAFSWSSFNNVSMRGANRIGSPGGRNFAHRTARSAIRPFVWQTSRHRLASTLDPHELASAIAMRDKAAVGAACDWAVEQGYLERGRVYVVTVPDEEEGGSLVFRFLDEAEAEEEARGYLEVDLDGDELEAAVTKAVRRTAGYVPTARLAGRMRHERDVPLALVVDLAVVAYAEDVLDVDGVWWEDTYDPARYSAPRGVLFARRLSTHRMALAEPEDEGAQ